MKYNKLGLTDLSVSEICLGTMTWGSQNSEAEAHAQIDYALDQGVNFIDTAELYPTTPLSAETQGDTEAFLGTWLAKSGRRDDIILATKITGRGNKWIRNGADISPEEIDIAIEASLKRLQTDCIDLYQLHWPNRGSYHFRQYWGYDPTKQDVERTQDHVHEVLEKLQDLINQGKIRHIGLSNETCWGTMQFLEISRNQGLPRMASIQNEYSLMQRIFDTDLAELSHNETVGLLAYSPLAAGMLSGKYIDGSVPKGSRRDVANDTLHGRYSDHSASIVEKYAAIAAANNLDLSQMSLAFCLTRPFMSSVIIGATTQEQLATNIGAKDVVLTKEVMQSIHEVHREFPLPF